MEWREEVISTSTGASIQVVQCQQDPLKSAFIAHPYARLGGSLNDHVVQSLATRLHKRGYSIYLINARGAGNSVGTPSFSGISEAEDYQDVVTHYLKASSSVLERHSGAMKPEVLLCGYSAGALSASYCAPPANTLTRYLLISYPLSVIWALTLFRSSPFATRLESLVRSGAPLLSVRGTQDQFTGSSKYDAWEKRLASEIAKFEKVDGADHFWSVRQDKEKMLEEVDKWLDQT